METVQSQRDGNEELLQLDTNKDTEVGEINAVLRKLEKMPDCALKTIIHLEKWIMLYYYDEGAIAMTQIQEAFASAGTQLEQEKWMIKMKDNWSDLRTKILSLNKDTVLVVCSLLRAIVKILRPFNVEEAVQLYQEAEASAQIIKDQNIIVLLARTGAGKSTTTHWLCGSKMAISKVNGAWHVSVDGEPPIKELEKIIISCKFVSETKYVSAISFSYDGATFLIVDTPGFGDNRGPELDVANGLGLVRSISTAESVRIILLIPKGFTTNKSEILRGCLQDLLLVFPGVNEYKCITFALTRYELEGKEETEIAEMKSDILESLKQYKL